MTDDPIKAARQRRFFLSMLGGGLAGYVAVNWGLVALFKAVPVTDPAAFAAAGVGLIYVLMGLFVGMGALLPRAGAKVLNVSGQEELQEQRAILLGGSLCYLVFGAALILLALATPAGPVSGGLALSAVVGSLVLSCLIGWLQWGKYDELQRQVNLESSSITLLIVLPVVIVWGAADYLGFAAGFSPLTVIALLALSVVVGAFIAAGRRSLLTQN